MQRIVGILLRVEDVLVRCHFLFGWRIENSLLCKNAPEISDFPRFAQFSPSSISCKTLRNASFFVEAKKKRFGNVFVFQRREEKPEISRR